VAVLTLAPDQPGAPELIGHARARGVVVALGHHRAEQADLDAAIRAGAAITTHLGNGSDAMLPRLDNVIWRQLGEDRLWASLITDGHHLPALTVKCMLRAKTPARCVLITDAVAAAGMPPGRYHLGDTEVERLPDGRVILPGTPFQAGSSAEMRTVLTRAIVDGGVSLIEAVRMASINPATLLFGQADPWSSADSGPANLVELEWNPRGRKMAVRRVVFGRWSAGRTGDD
jgi:N-acetylglucosamine-6-phosphate deacetylase